MENLILFDGDNRDNLLPFTYTRPVSEIRVGIMTIREKWEHRLNLTASHITQDHLAVRYPIKIEKTNLIINGSVLPNENIITLIKGLEVNEALVHEDLLIAARIPDTALDENDEAEHDFKGFELSSEEFSNINKPSDIFSLNGQEIENDFELMTRHKTTKKLSSSNTIIGDGPIYIDPSANVEGAMINTNDGPIYIGENATVMEGALIRGPFALCDNSTLKMGAKIYGATTIGPHCKVGGEINNSVFFSHSNKAHDGFIGNSVIGQWCNIGADTNNSNLKNNYAEVKLWDYTKEGFQNTGLQFCGLIMADHAKCGINTMFNTGTVVGVGANVFGSGFPRNFVPSFSWGGASGFSTFKLPKMYEVAEKVMQRRKIEFTEIDKEIINAVYEFSSKYRSWEKK